MPTKRTRVARQLSDSRITPEAASAWRRGDYWALWSALGLRLWQMPDWNLDPPEEARPPLPGFERELDTAALKAALVAAAGPPPRSWRYRRD